MEPKENNYERSLSGEKGMQFSSSRKLSYEEEEQDDLDRKAEVDDIISEELVELQSKREDKGEVVLEEASPRKIEQEGLEVSLTERIFEDGNRSYLLDVNPRFVQECYVNDQKWDQEFRKNIGPDYPYTMSPKTTKLIAALSSDVKTLMSKAGFEIDPWKVGSEEEPYVMGVLRRVMVTDTIEPIIGYTDEIVRYLREIKQKNPDQIPSVRSFFCGAAVADKCLIARMHESGFTGNLISTDKAADSVAIASLNLTVWNELLPEKDKYDIHLVRGDIPEELYSRDKTIVLQVADAMSAAERDSVVDPSFDALLIDNGLQYMSKDFTNKLVANVLPNSGSEGLYIGTLGLDSNIKVDIPKTYHITQILRSFTADLRKLYKKKMKFNAPYDYPHKYSFDVSKEGLITIDKVVSDGAARMYMWLRKLLINDTKMFKEVMDSIKSATELSRANNAVETNPFDYHQAMLDSINSSGLSYEEIERPLNYEDYGWKKIGEDLYEKNNEKVDGGTMMRLCRIEDPLVLRRSRIKVEPMQD